MPAPKQIDPTSLASGIKLFLWHHPGEAFRPRDIARKITRPESRTVSQWTVDVGRECSRMADRGTLERVPGTTMTKGNVPASTYRLTQQ